MKRNAIKKLIIWKESKDHKPVLITGVKGVGKTYLALDFAKSFYEGNLYINFENNASIRDFIIKRAEDKDVNLMSLLCEYYQIPEELAGNLLFILDEIQVCTEAVRLLTQYVKAYSGKPVLRNREDHLLQERIPVIILSSQADLRFAEESEYHQIHLTPMGFDEFLCASGQEWYAEVIKAHFQTNRKIPQIVHTELLTLFEDYLLVGGMPAAVNEYINADSSYNVSEIHHVLYNNIYMNASRLFSEGEALKIHQVLNVLVEQLIKENKKFQFRVIRKGATYTMFKDAIEYLTTQGYLLRCNKVSNIDLSEDKSRKNRLSSEDNSQFKLYLEDVGILNSLIEKNVVHNETTEELIRKTLIENYTLQALHANGFSPRFWESSSQAKVEFIIDTKEGIVPIETKTSDTSRSKSISVFKNQYEIPYSIRISSKNYEYSNGVKNIPYYAIFCL